MAKLFFHEICTIHNWSSNRWNNRIHLNKESNGTPFEKWFKTLETNSNKKRKTVNIINIKKIDQLHEIFFDTIELPDLYYSINEKAMANRNILVFIEFRSEHSFRIGMLEIEQRKENYIIDTSENNVFFFLLWFPNNGTSAESYAVTCLSIWRIASNKIETTIAITICPSIIIKNVPMLGSISIPTIICSCDPSDNWAIIVRKSATIVPLLLQWNTLIIVCLTSFFQFHFQLYRWCSKTNRIIHYYFILFSSLFLYPLLLK